MELLTKKQREFLEVLKDFIESNKQSPTITELQRELRKKGFSVESRRSITQYLEALEKKHFIVRDSQPRGIYLIDAQGEAMVNVPILGMANAGPAAYFAQENFLGMLKISKRLLKKRRNIFALEVKGNSLDSARIGGKAVSDGDWVIIDKDYAFPQNGDYVLSVIEGVANLKRFYFDRDNQQIVLCSQSTEDHPPIFIHPSDTYMVNGKILQVIKRPKLIRAE